MGATVVHDAVKFVVTIAVLVVLVIAMALMVSSYLTAFNSKPSGGTTPAVVTGGTGGGISKARPSPSGMPQNVTAAGGMPPYGQYPPQLANAPQPEQEMPPAESYMPVPGSQNEIPYIPAPSPTPAPLEPSPTTMPRAPSYEQPTMPMPGGTGWYDVIEELFRLLPFIFSGRFNGFPWLPQLFG
jgi:hypothetical protein